MQEGSQGKETSDQLEEELHRLDSELDRIRRRIIWLGATRGEEAAAEVESLKQRQSELEQRFVETYRRWNR